MVIVYLNTYGVTLGINPVTKAIGEFDGLGITATGPETKVQFPTPPDGGKFPIRVVPDILQSTWSDPASATGAATMVSTIELTALVHGALAVAVRVSVTFPAAISAALGV